jgi:hypothetical protein
VTIDAISRPKALREFRLAQQALKERRVVEALGLVNKSASCGYDDDDCAALRWHCWMFLGNFGKAWRESEAIISRGNKDATCLWDGSAFEGKRIVIRCLHGFGDAVQFIRYGRILRSQAARIIVETHAELISLFSGISWIDQVVSWADGSSDGFNDWDQQIEVMELPRAFGTTLLTIPSKVPYLSVTGEALARSEYLLGGRAGEPKIGLVWRAGDWDPARSVPCAQFARIAHVPGLRFYSFQRGPATREGRTLREDGRIHDTARHSPDISDTAADIVNMDLVITVDTMVAHLAGALGRKVWTLLPYEADWRWMLDTSSSPWYPTMRLFRQQRPGDWTSVLQDVAGSLRAEFGAGQ